MTPLAQDAAKGFILGLSIAAPVGPIGLLCIRRALERGALAGIAGGLGTAAADATYAAVAAFGITAVSAPLAAAATPLQAAGIAVLMALGIKTFRQVPAGVGASQETEHARLFVQMFFLTLTNPTTILSFAAVFAGLGLVSGGNAARAAALVTGTFTGSLAWWIVLSMAVSLARGWMTVRTQQWINRGAGVLLMGLAAALAIKLLQT